MARINANPLVTLAASAASFLLPMFTSTQAIAQLGNPSCDLSLSANNSEIRRLPWTTDQIILNGKNVTLDWAARHNNVRVVQLNVRSEGFVFRFYEAAVPDFIEAFNRDGVAYRFHPPQASQQGYVAGGTCSNRNSVAPTVLQFRAATQLAVALQLSPDFQAIVRNAGLAMPNLSLAPR